MNFNQRAIADADAISRHESQMASILSKPHKMNEAVCDYLTTYSNSLTLARICLTAQTDEAEAGRQLKEFARIAAHESARVWLGDDAEVIEPVEPAKPADPQEFTRLVHDIFGMPRPLQDRVDGARGIKK